MLIYGYRHSPKSKQKIWMACYGRATLHRVAFIVEVGLIVRLLDGVGPERFYLHSGA